MRLTYWKTVIISLFALITIAFYQNFSFAPTKPRFRIVWLEPHSINISVTGRAGQLSSQDLKMIIRNYKDMGVETIVVAYTEFLNQFLFKANSDFTFTSFDKDLITGNQITTQVHSKQSYNPLLSDGDFLDTLMAEAKNQNIQVYLGLSRTGDVHLLADIYHHLNNQPTSKAFPWYDVTSRLTASIYYSKLIANDLWNRYYSNPAFAGWYLTHETSCLDIGLNYYQPMARYLKLISPGKKVMVSPLSDARSCFASDTYLELVDKNKAWIDTYAYQDSIGSGSLYINGIPRNFYTDAARGQRIAELRAGRLQQLKLIHAQTGTHFWMNLEAWEMNGNCPTGILEADGSGHRWGCNYPGPWARVVSQLTSWSAFTPNLMVNEGFTQFDFGIANAQLRNNDHARRAKDFTESYKAYLLAP